MQLILAIIDAFLNEPTLFVGLQAQTMCDGWYYFMKTNYDFSFLRLATYVAFFVLSQ
jgi:hypothetical protein